MKSEDKEVAAMRKKKNGITAIKERYGYLFVAPWVIGIILFVIGPIFTFFSYGFCDLAFSETGMETTFAGLKYYKYVYS